MFQLEMKYWKDYEWQYGSSTSSSNQKNNQEVFMPARARPVGGNYGRGGYDQRYTVVWLITDIISIDDWFYLLIFLR